METVGNNRGFCTAFLRLCRKRVGGVNIFYAETNSEKLSLFLDSGSVKDKETGTEWNSAGLGVAGPLEGEQLLPAPAVQHFWFSAYVFSDLGL